MSRLAHAWPSLLAPGDPYAGDEVLGQEGFREKWAVDPADEARLLQAVRDWWERAAPFPQPLAAALGLDGEVRHSTHRPDTFDPPDDLLEVLVRVSTNHLPAVGQEAPDRLLGPWVDEASLHDALVRSAFVSAVAQAGLWNRGLRRPSATHRWAKDLHKPDPALRRAVHALRRAPPGLWRLLDEVDGRWVVEDLVGLGEHWCPPGLVSLWQPGAVAGPPRVGGVLASRLLPGPDGWVAALPLCLPVCPPSDAVKLWWRARLWQLRARWPGVTQEEALVQAPALLCRAAHEWAWTRL